MKLGRLLLAGTGIVALAVILPSFLAPGLPSWTSPPSGGPGPPQVYTWSDPNYDGPLGGGISHADVLPIPVLPAGTSTVYVDGSFQMVSWTQLTNGLINRTGNCANAFSPPDACGLFVALWTPSNWSVFAAGGPADPIWCSPNGEPCIGMSSGTVATPNLSGLAGESWEIVVWNVGAFDLDGSYQFTVYSNTAPSGT